MDEENQQQRGNHPQPVRRKPKFNVAAVGLIVILIGVAVITLHSPGDASKVPPPILQAQQKVGFTLYYPDRPPVGFSLDTTSVSAGSHAVLYSCIYKSKRVSISVQPRSTQVTADQFRPTSEFTTHIGRAYIVDLEDRTTAAVLGKDSWVLINAPETIPIEEMRGLIDSLHSVPH